MIIIFWYKIIAVVYSIQVSIPLYVHILFIFTLISMIIPFAMIKVYDLIWSKQLNDFNVNLLDKKLFFKITKNLYINNSEKEYYSNNNSFIKEFFYFLVTTSVIFMGLLLKNTFLISLFFIVSISRKIITLNKINNLALQNFKIKKINENDIYKELFLVYEKDLIKYFESKNNNICDDLLSLELKFKELVRNGNINKDILIDLMNYKKLSSNTINMINVEYSKLMENRV